METLDIVDENDNITGTASKDDVYNRKLRHRIVHVMIFNPDGEVALQLRSGKVSFCPNHWSTAVGGHVQSGETYMQGAKREYMEELGVTSNLTFLGKDIYAVPGRPEKFVTTFTTVFTGTFFPDREAVEKVEYFTLNKIKQMISDGEKFHPELLFVLNKYFLD